MKGFEQFLRENKGPLSFLIILIAVIGAAAGFKYYKYTQENPQFCSSCHLMQEAFKSWQISSHKQLPCQICHKMNIFEQNKLLVAFVVNPKGKISQKHGKISPWTVCKDCHMYDISQGSITLKNSYGHARHVFMQGIGCDKCHVGDLHAFSVTRNACQECHKDKLIHGMGMEGLNCINCHSFAESTPKMISRERCLRCHKDNPKSAPMSELNCFDCHKPHGKIKMESDDCLGRCHGNESKVGQHGIHLNKAKLTCFDCHKAHTWVVGKKEALGLCDRCHKIKDPVSFIY